MKLEYYKSDGESKGADKKYVTEDPNSYEHCNIAIPEDVVIVDIDNPKLTLQNLRGIFEILNIETMYFVTDRGFHIWFQKDPTFRAKAGHHICKLGVSVEYKTAKNTPNGINFKRNGKERKCYNKGILSPLHNGFTVLAKAEHELLGIMDGEGRHTKLVSHTTRLIKNERQLLMDCINECIIGEKIPHDKLEGIINWEGNQSSFELGEMTNHIVNLYDLWVYDNRLYHKEISLNKHVYDELLLKRLIEVNFPHLEPKDIKNVYDKCILRAPMIPRNKKEFPVNFKNGCIMNKQVMPVKYSDFTPYYLDIDYDKNAPIDKTVEKLIYHITGGDKDYRKYLLQACAYPLIYDLSFKRHHGLFFIFIGNGNNGKGTLMQLLNKIYDGSVSNIKLEEMTERSKFASMKDKLINLGDDVDDTPITNTLMSALKSVTTADIVSIRDVYEKTSTGAVAPTCMFTSNSLLKSFDKTSAYKRRVKWLPVFGEVINKDKNFLDKLLSDKSVKYFFKLIIEEVEDLIENGFVECKKIDEYTTNYHQYNNNTILFFTDNNIDDYVKSSFKVVKEEYHTWCDMNGEKPLSDKVLKDEISNLGYEHNKPTSMNGKSVRVIMRRDKQ